MTTLQELKRTKIGRELESENLPRRRQSLMADLGKAAEDSLNRLETFFKIRDPSLFPRLTLIAFWNTMYHNIKLTIVIPDLRCDGGLDGTLPTRLGATPSTED